MKERWLFDGCSVQGPNLKQLSSAIELFYFLSQKYIQATFYSTKFDFTINYFFGPDSRKNEELLSL